MPAQENPSELKSALGFAALYAIVVLGGCEGTFRTTRALYSGHTLGSDRHGCDHALYSTTRDFCPSGRQSRRARNRSAISRESGIQVHHRCGARATPTALPHRTVVRSGVAGWCLNSVALAGGLNLAASLLRSLAL